MYRPHDFRVRVHVLASSDSEVVPLLEGAVQVAGGPAGLAYDSLIEVGHLRGQSARATPGGV